MLFAVATLFTVAMLFTVATLRSLALYPIEPIGQVLVF